MCVCVTLSRSFHCGPKHDLYGRPIRGMLCKYDLYCTCVVVLMCSFIGLHMCSNETLHIYKVEIT